MSEQNKELLSNVKSINADDLVKVLEKIKFDIENILKEATND